MEPRWVMRLDYWHGGTTREINEIKQENVEYWLAWIFLYQLKGDLATHLDHLIIIFFKLYKTIPSSNHPWNLGTY